jgi:hypothetical protein
MIQLGVRDVVQRGGPAEIVDSSVNQTRVLI